MACNHLIIIEGPAGSGKSTAIAVAVDSQIAIFPEEYGSFERPRDYRGPHGRMLARAKDYALSMGFLANVMEGGLPTIVDRWLFSSIVYDSIREKRLPTLYPAPSRINSLALAAQELITEGRFKSVRSLKLSVIVTVPSLTDLLRMRSNRAKTYPFPAQDERLAYLGMLNVCPNPSSFFYEYPRLSCLLEFTLVEDPNKLLETIADVAARG